MGNEKFVSSSRYINVEITSTTGADGVEVRHLRRRLIPRPAGPALGEYKVVEGDRLDRIAAATLGDPLLQWRLADANAAMDPDELTRQLGRSLRIAIDTETINEQAEDVL